MQERKGVFNDVPQNGSSERVLICRVRLRDKLVCGEVLGERSGKFAGVSASEGGRGKTRDRSTRRNCRRTTTFVRVVTLPMSSLLGFEAFEVGTKLLPVDSISSG